MRSLTLRPLGKLFYFDLFQGVFWVIILWGRGNKIAHGITCICPTMSYLDLFFAGDVPLNDKITPVAIDLIVTSAEVKRSTETENM